MNHPAPPVPPGITPLDLEGRKLYDLESAALALAENWEGGKKLLYRGLLTFFLSQFSQSVASKAVDYSEERDQDMGLFKLIYVLNPNAPLCWQGEFFADLHALSDIINQKLPQVNQGYLQLLTKGALAEYLRLKKADAWLISTISELQQAARSNPNRAYYRLARLLGNNNELRFKGSVFTNADQLAEYLYQESEQIENLANMLLGREEFLAWLEHLGYKEHVARWEKINR